MCDYQGCDQEPEFYDDWGDLVCSDCMEREIYDSDVTDYDFEPIIK